MKKDIKSITEKEAKEILEYLFPNETSLSNPKNYKYNFTKISHEMVLDKEGYQQISFGGRSLIGIFYYNDKIGDECILHFDDIRILPWLYENDYDILDLLKENIIYYDMGNNFDNFAFAVLQLSKGVHAFAEGYKQNWNLEYVHNKCVELLDEYFYECKGATQNIIGKYFIDENNNI